LPFHAATKNYVDAAVTAIGARYYAYDSASGIEDYKECFLIASNDAEASVTKAGLVDGDYVQGWISTADNTPDKLIAGVYDFTIFAEKTAGTKTLQVYWELVERKSDDSEIVIATSQDSVEITDKAKVTPFIVLSDDYVLSAGSRVIGKIRARVTGSGNAPTIKLYYQGDLDSHWEIPANTEILTNIFVPYENAVKSVDLSDYNLTAYYLFGLLDSSNVVGISDYNYDTSAKTECDANQAYTGSGNCVDLTGFHIDKDTGVKWVELDALTPWSDTNVADDLTINSSGSVAWTALQNVPDFVKTSALPLADENVADDITLTNITQITNRDITDIQNYADVNQFSITLCSGDANSVVNSAGDCVDLTGLHNKDINGSDVNINGLWVQNQSNFFDTVNIRVYGNTHFGYGSDITSTNYITWGKEGKTVFRAYDESIPAYYFKFLMDYNSLRPYYSNKDINLGQYNYAWNFLFTNNLVIGNTIPRRLLTVYSPTSNVLAEFKTSDNTANAYALVDINAGGGGTDTVASLRFHNDATGYQIGVGKDDKYKISHGYGADLTQPVLIAEGYPYSNAKVSITGDLNVDGDATIADDLTVNMI